MRGRWELDLTEVWNDRRKWNGESSGFGNFDARACSALVSLTENLLSSEAANGKCRG